MEGVVLALMNVKGYDFYSGKTIHHSTLKSDEYIYYNRYEYSIKFNDEHCDIYIYLYLITNIIPTPRVLPFTVGAPKLVEN